MAWYDEAVFYHIYPLGMTDAPKENAYEAPVSRLRQLFPWISHLKRMGFNALYIGPLFESVGHGYETTDYKKLDSRLGTNQDLKDFVQECHKQEIRVVFDGVFNHTGRDFFAFQDVKKNRESSPYRDWFCNVNFYGNNEYNDGFSYDNWGGYNLLVKLNQRNPAVRDYIHDVISFWVSEFDVDGIRLDAADVLDFDFMKSLRALAEHIKPEFWLMGEVIHGDYTRWVNENTLHCVTNYHLHKALYSGHNDHNFFEIAHTVKRLYGMGGNRPDGLKLYNFVDNHDVERIYTKLTNKAQYFPVHILLYTLPGIPSVYYGSEFAIEGRKERGSDASLRPALRFADYQNALESNAYTKFVARLGQIRRTVKALSYGDYQELVLTNRQYAFSRTLNGEKAVIAVNNDENPASFGCNIGCDGRFVGLLSGKTYDVSGTYLSLTLDANSGDILVPAAVAEKLENMDLSPVTIAEKEKPQDAVANTVKTDVPEANTDDTDTDNTGADSETNAGNTGADSESNTDNAETVSDRGASNADKDAAAPSPLSFSQDRLDKAFEDGKIAGLQEAILAIMSKNGPVTDQMRRDVENNVYHDSLINWIKSFR